MRTIVASVLILFFALTSHAQTRAKLPTIPTTGTYGTQGSVGVGFTDFVVLSPPENFKLERGTYAAVAIERGFDLFHLYFTMNLSQMNAEGKANYTYSNLSSSTTYTATDVDFTAQLTDLSLGFKLKFIDGYWFRPYVEGGGIGSYYQLTYKSKIDVLNSQGSEWKRHDVIMGSGYYGEAGIEVQFAERFGVKFGARYSEQQSKELETQNKDRLKFRAETYYFSALFGF